VDRIYLYRQLGQWRWHRIAPNGLKVGASTEGYLHRKDALANLQRVNGPADGYVLDELEDAEPSG
jgi:uncharacterized protein YegP (UPF0339 family)